MTQPTTIVHKITNAVLKIGSNGTKITQPSYTGEDKSNEVTARWFDQWSAISEYLIASAIEKCAANRAEKAKAALNSEFATTLSNVKVGDKNTIVRGNVTVTFDRRNAPRRIARQSVVTTLSTAPYNWKLEEITKLLEKVETASPDGAMYITTSMIAE